MRSLRHQEGVKTATLPLVTKCSLVPIDHIISGKHGTNDDGNLRVLCRRCHILRADRRHRGMIAAALRDGIIPPTWRALVWDDE